MKHPSTFKIFLFLLVILGIFGIATMIFTVFAIPENSEISFDGQDSIIPPISDIDDSTHLISMISDDGYMKITIYNEPSPDDSDCYYMHVWIDWLKTPISRMTDTLLIQYPSFTLATSTEQYSVMTYTTTGLSGKQTPHHVEQGHYLGEWDLPKSTPLQRVSNIRIYARVKLYVTLPSLSQVLQTYVNYTHYNALTHKKTSYALLSPMIEYIPEIKTETE